MIFARHYQRTMRMARAAGIAIVVCLLIPQIAPASAGNITTYAGGGVGDGGPALDASLSYPYGVAVDPAGNVFIAQNYRVRKVDTSGTITTVAGNGNGGYSGDGGPATGASLLPTAVAIDSAGNLFIADPTNNRIRKVDTSGTVTTVAGTGTFGFSGDGGPATSARLNNPLGVAVDSAGNLFIADTANSRIRKVDASGIITRVGGYLSSPYGVAVDSAGNLFIADTANNRIQKMDPSGTITTVAGNGAGYHYGDGGPAIHASFSSPAGVAVDPAGNLFIAVSGHHRIRRVDTSGTITTVAGMDTNGGGFSGDGGPATSASLRRPRGVAVGGGSLFIADTGNQRIRSVDTSGTITTTAGMGSDAYIGDGGPATSAGLATPIGVAADSAGNLFIADTGNHRIRKVTTSGIITTVAGTGAQGYSGDGGPATFASLDHPSGVAVDSAGNLFVADTYNNRIRQVNALGTITTVAGNGGVLCLNPMLCYLGDGGPAVIAYLNHPVGVALGSSGDLFIADADNNRIRKVDSLGMISTVAGNGIQGYSGDGGPAISASLDAPAGIALDSAGNLFIADFHNHRIRKVTLGLVISTVAGSGTPGYSGDGGLATSGNLNLPSGVAVDSIGNLYIADSGNHRVRRVDTSGMMTTAAGSALMENSGDGGPATSAGLTTPTGVALDPVGNLFIADFDRIRKVAA